MHLEVINGIVLMSIKLLIVHGDGEKMVVNVN